MDYSAGNEYNLVIIGGPSETIRYTSFIKVEKIVQFIIEKL